MSNYVVGVVDMSRVFKSAVSLCTVRGGYAAVDAPSDTRAAAADRMRSISVLSHARTRNKPAGGGGHPLHPYSYTSKDIVPVLRAVRIQTITPRAVGLQVRGGMSLIKTTHPPVVSARVTLDL